MNACATTADSAPSPARSQVNLKFLFAVLLLCWTALVGLSLWHNNSRLADHARDSARIQALTAFEKDVIYRRWNSIHGGVFVAVEDGKLAPNPYLAPKGREISDAGGKVYTKVNPAFMTRLVHEIGELHSGVRGHITSNNPIRPGNAPDPWESAALKLLEEGAATEVAEVLELDGRPYLRYISGLVTEQSCLSCHAFQGYKVGDIRGGISVAVPMTPFYAALRESSQTLWLTHGALWLAGLCGISFGMNRLGRRVKERDQAESQLRKLAQELEERVARRTADLKAKQREMQAFVDNVDAGVFLKSTDGVYSFANARFASILNLPPAQIPGRLNAEILPPALARAVDAVEGEVIAQSCGAEYRPQAEDGINTGYSFFIFPVLEEGQAVGLGGLVVDMTHRDQAEEALRRARDAAERANQAKSDFLANMSHEIRTPLNGVIGMADILLRTELTPEQSSMASAIKTSGDALLLVLNDILDLSKVESGRLALEKSPFSLRETLFSAAISVTHIAYGKDIELILDIADEVPDRLVGDSTRLRQIILNLANNALKFTEEGEVRIGVTLDWRHASSARLHFVVSDTGIGIPEEKQNGIFNAFEQADTSITRKYGGTGLGLAICVSFLQLMNSSIRLQSKVGKGSRFSFFLDLPMAEGATGLTPLPSLAGKEILIADKHP
ncbi:DUF3365 domain-containing protein, partial [Desulfovibrio sp. OttesenSCG-928-C14]|nr:DUF3365 domain-containing protein [Desulfovibrio sp. OttesenSCG-928-C14]